MVGTVAPPMCACVVGGSYIWLRHVSAYTVNKTYHSRDLTQLVATGNR